MNQYAFGGVGSATGMGGGGGGAEGMGRGGGAGISGAEAAPMVGKSADTTAAEPGIRFNGNRTKHRLLQLSLHLKPLLHRWR